MCIIYLQAHLIFEILELVLLRIADDLTKFKAVGQNIVRRILAVHMGLVYTTLAMRNKSGHIKGVLKLLTAMIMQGESSAKEFQAQFDFQNRNIKPLLNRRDGKVCPYELKLYTRFRFCNCVNYHILVCF